MTRASARSANPPRLALRAPWQLGALWLAALAAAGSGCTTASAVRAQGPTPSTHAPAPGSLQSTRAVPSQAYAAYCRGLHALRARDYAMAADCFELVVSLDPDADAAYPDLLYCCAALQQQGRAAPYLKQWSKRRPNDFGVHARIGAYFVRLGRRAEAIAELEQARHCPLPADSKRAHQRLVQVLLQLAKLYLDTARLDPALDCYKQMRQATDEPEAAIEYKIAEAYYDFDHYEMAAAHFEKVRAQKPTHLGALRYLTICYDKTKQYERSIAAAKAYLSLVPRDAAWPMRAHLADLYEQTLQFDKAKQMRSQVRATLTKRVAAGSQDLAERIALARMLRLDRQFDKAVAVLEKGRAQLAPNTAKPAAARFYLALARAYYDHKDAAKCEKALRSALELEPDSHEAANFLGYFYAERGENLQEAERLVRQALKSAPDNPLYLDSLGWVYYQQGVQNRNGEKLQQALSKLLQAALELQDPVIREHIGDVYYALKNLGEAKKHWERALKLWQKMPSPSPPGPESVKRKLSQLEMRDRKAVSGHSD